MASSVHLAPSIHGRGFALDRDEAARSLMASLSHGDRSEALRFVRTATLDVHGDDDPLIPWRAGRRPRGGALSRACDVRARWGSW